MFSVISVMYRPIPMGPVAVVLWLYFPSAEALELTENLLVVV